MRVLSGFRVAELGRGLAAAVCGRLLADVGAEVACVDPDTSVPIAAYLNYGKTAAARDALQTANLIVCEARPRELRTLHCDVASLRRLNATAAIVFISPFGQTGPKANDPASDLTLMYSSGIARLLTGQVDDLNEAPIRPIGEQSSFIGGLAAACAGMHAAQPQMSGAIIDVSIEEALATMAMAELTGAGLYGRSRPRKRLADGNGATVCILPARDGYTAISPREDRQWRSWLDAMGSTSWGNDARFATKADRVTNWNALHALMSAWSCRHDKQWIADTAQAARVPSFPLREPAEQLESRQLQHRDFYRAMELGDRTIRAPGSPFGITLAWAETTAGKAAAELPLAGVRVLDFSWVIAGPTATRYLAAMGADVIKVEAPGRGDPGRTSELHTVLGQAKRGVVLDLKRPNGVDIARALAERCDVLIENFATGVMDRLGLGADTLRQRNPRLIYVSASGLGRSGPESHAVAYGTLLQCYAGFAGLNRHPGIPPRVGFAWLDPMCGLMLAFIVAAAIWQRRRSGAVARVDFSMIEAMLWTMAEPLLTTQCGVPPTSQGNASDRHAPHGAWRCAGDDAWISIAVANDQEWRRLCRVIVELSPLDRVGQPDEVGRVLAEWLHTRTAQAAEGAFVRAGVPAASLATAGDLVASHHLRERGFWEPHRSGVLPGLPWRASFTRSSADAPGLGADTDTVLTEVLGLSPDALAALRGTGVLG